MFKAMIIAGLGGFIGTCLRFLVGSSVIFIVPLLSPGGLLR